MRHGTRSQIRASLFWPILYQSRQSSVKRRNWLGLIVCRPADREWTMRLSFLPFVQVRPSPRLIAVNPEASSGLQNANYSTDIQAEWDAADLLHKI